LCFNSFLNNNIYVEGIKGIDKTDIDNANKLGFKIKLLGFAEILNNKIYQRVHPTLIKKDSYVASIDGVLNAVIVDGKPVGQSIVQGEGAGPAATTSALVSDISSILRGNVKFPFSLSNKERKKLIFDNIKDRFFSAYLRFEVKDKPGVLSNITNVFSKNKVSIKRLVQNPNKNKKISSIIIITHNSKDKSLNKILKEISKKNYIKKKPKLIRIDNT
jgi:homoserine dehydrogenase